jgi:hypothetical protein
LKLVVTILQARRVVMPYIFVKHALPRMRAAFPGEIEVVLVQHRSLPDAQRADPFLETTKTDPAWGRRVVEWTDAGKFAGADVVTHEIHNPNYPSIPTFHRACAEALARRADFHLWLEDDALVCDESCGRWPEIFGDREMGVYRYFSEVNAAFFVSRPGFDERALPGLARYERWTKDERIERYLRRQLRTPRAHLNPAHAVRSHRNPFPYTGVRFVAEMVRRIAPEDAHLLDIELGEGTSRLDPVSQRELAWLWVRDWARPIELARRAKNTLIEHARGLTD